MKWTAFSQKASSPLVAEVEVPDALVATWSSKGRKHLITHLELFPILVGLHRLAPHLRNRKALLFVDNNGVRDAVLKGCSKVDDVFAMLSSIFMILNTCVLSLWTTHESHQRATLPIGLPGAKPRKQLALWG